MICFMQLNTTRNKVSLSSQSFSTTRRRRWRKTVLPLLLLSLQLTEQALRDGLEQIAVVAHGGTQMAVLEKWAGSDRQYWEWQTACGCGWALDTACWPENLQVEGNVRYTVQEES